MKPAIKTFIPKDDRELPDSYGATIFYIDGRSEEFRIANHNLSEDKLFFEFATDEDEWNWIEMSNVKRIKWDKDFSKMIAIKHKMIAEQRKKEAEEAKKSQEKRQRAQEEANQRAMDDMAAKLAKQLADRILSTPELAEKVQAQATTNVVSMSSKKHATKKRLKKKG